MISQAFLDQRSAAIALAPFYKRRRPAAIRALGHMLHPEAVTEAWYAARCPSRLKRRGSGLSRRVWCCWWVSVHLRGADR